MYTLIILLISTDIYRLLQTYTNNDHMHNTIEMQLIVTYHIHNTPPQLEIYNHIKMYFVVLELFLTLDTNDK